MDDASDDDEEEEDDDEEDVDEDDDEEEDEEQGEKSEKSSSMTEMQQKWEDELRSALQEANLHRDNSDDLTTRLPVVVEDIRESSEDGDC